MYKEFLERADTVAALKQMGDPTWPKASLADPLKIA